MTRNQKRVKEGLTIILIFLGVNKMEYTITETIKTVRQSIKKDFKQTIIDEMEDEDLIMFALRFLLSNTDEEYLK